MVVECKADKIKKCIEPLSQLAVHDAYITRLLEKFEIYNDFRNAKGTAISRFCDLSIKYKLSESRIEKICREMADKVK